MNLSRFFVDRPIFASVLSIVITLVGALAYLSLPVAQYPEVAPPTVIVTASYPGADAQTLAETVSTPLEQEINGVERMLYMSSSSTSDGRVQITITFELGTDLDKSQVLVQNRVNSALPRLPEDVRRQGIIARKQSPDLTLAAQFFSPDGSRDVAYLANYVTLQVRDRVARIKGVADANSLGGQDFTMRIWLDPEKLSSRSLTAGDVTRALREQNLQIAGGSLGQPPVAPGTAFQYTLVAQGRLLTTEEFGDVVLKAGEGGDVTRVRDVARVELGARDYSTKTYMDGYNAVSLRVFQLPGSNAIETADEIYRVLNEMRRSFPPGVDFRINYDPTQFIRESMSAVLHTLVEALILVVIVVVVFLQTWRASVIPLLAVPVSLIGTLAVMKLFGFSLNNLSLFGLVLAIGIVVDDAIVVVENVERFITNGFKPREATIKAMQEVTGPVIAVALVLCAVFVPTAFISGITGQFYKQFALTIAVSTVISAFNSLTLSPALCALLLPEHGAPRDRFTRVLDRLLGWFFRGFNRVFKRASDGYAGGVQRLLRIPAVALVVYAGLVALGVFTFVKVPTGFIPSQDMGYYIVVVQLPDASSFERTDAVVRQVDEISRRIPGISHTFAISGYSSVLQANQPNLGAAFLVLDSFEKRKGPELRGERLLATIRKELSVVTEGRVLILPPPPLRGLGNAGGFKLQVQDLNNAGLASLEGATRALVDAAQRDPELVSVITGYRPNVPQFRAQIDRQKAKSMGVSMADIGETLQTYLGSVYVNDFNLFGRTWQVYAQADPQFRTNPDTVGQLKTRNNRGEMVPLASVARIERTGGADRIQRYNLFYSADISGSTQPGVSSGQMIQKLEGLARENLPEGFSIEWTDLTYQQIVAGNTIVYIFPLCVVFAFLVLAAQYESWSLPLAVILIVPMCLLSAIGGVWYMRGDNNVFTQIGLVVLVGLAVKNAILIVEFARQREEAGLRRREAAIEACRLRLRPILMTSFAFILGVVPLLRASGAGAEMRQALGTAVFFGMLGVTFFGLMLTPVFYLVVRGAAERMRKSRTRALVPAASTAGLVLLAATFTGCAVGPDYHRPASTAPSSFVHGASVGVTNGTLDVAWWRSFRDPLLDRLVDRAVTNNFDLQRAQARLREARALWTEARFDYVPTVRADAGFEKSQISRDAAGPRTRHSELYRAGFDATWELDLWGAVRRDVEAARATVESVEATRDDVLVAVQAEMTASYVELRGTQSRLTVATRNATNQAETLNLAIALRDGGQGTQLDVARARSLLNETLASIPPLENLMNRAIHRIGVLCGAPPTSLTNELGPYVALLEAPAELALSQPEELLRHRPDVRAAERSLAAATARIGLETADYFPRVTLVGRVGVEASQLSGLTAAGSDTYSFGPRITWAALDMGRVRQRVKAAGARAEQALAIYEQTVLLVLEEVENSFVALSRERQRVSYLAEAEKAAGEAVSLARQRYRDGIADYLSVLDSERTLLNLQEQLVNAQTLSATRLVAVYKAFAAGRQLSDE